ncbi:hypothetical protein [Cupriavidus sp. AcVe19-6a]|uniref:hypothetical protein n=1 Tax=Cupriavidus sp. AcVe19-6a TaxID=2821358 RepID=UPI001AE63936|nr:hypothetical protein [Cupriavidus sp. AcVe19-6a]MBP0634251.1 hypothetical protein [Cupriavidus sp. AcVe19-6a]
MKVIDLIERLGDALGNRIGKNEREIREIVERLDRIEAQQIEAHREQAKRARAPFSVAVK